MRRGQAALEFLTTYGWAFMVILVAIGALSYLGVTNPDRFVPDRCLAPQGFSCLDYEVTDSLLRVFLTNDLGQSVELDIDDFLVRLTSSGARIDDGCHFRDRDDEFESSLVTLGVTQQIQVVCRLDSGLSEGSKTRLELVGEYRRTSGIYNQPLVMEIVATVREGSTAQDLIAPSP